LSLRYGLCDTSVVRADARALPTVTCGIQPALPIKSFEFMRGAAGAQGEPLELLALSPDGAFGRALRDVCSAMLFLRGSSSALVAFLRRSVTPLPQVCGGNLLPLCALFLHILRKGLKGAGRGGGGTFYVSGYNHKRVFNVPLAGVTTLEGVQAAAGSAAQPLAEALVRGQVLAGMLVAVFSRVREARLVLGVALQVHAVGTDGGSVVVTLPRTTTTRQAAGGAAQDPLNRLCVVSGEEALAALDAQQGRGAVTLDVSEEGLLAFLGADGGGGGEGGAGMGRGDGSEVAVAAAAAAALDGSVLGALSAVGDGEGSGAGLDGSVLGALSAAGEGEGSAALDGEDGALSEGGGGGGSVEVMEESGSVGGGAGAEPRAPVPGLALWLGLGFGFGLGFGLG
jgi:hypothetical protein